MPAFASATSYGRNWRHLKIIALAVMIFIGAGCDDGTDEIDERMATRHAEANAALLADRTIVYAREWVLFHPQSDRQRHAREKLLYLQELEDSMPDEHSRQRRDDIERQLEGVYRWRDTPLPNLEENR